MRLLLAMADEAGLHEAFFPVSRYQADNIDDQDRSYSFTASLNDFFGMLQNLNNRRIVLVESSLECECGIELQSFIMLLDDFINNKQQYEYFKIIIEFINPHEVTFSRTIFTDRN